MMVQALCCVRKLLYGLLENMELLIVVTQLLTKLFRAINSGKNLTWAAELGSPCSTELLLHHWHYELSPAELNCPKS